jgi:transcriptional regulator with XRE-family HTH domain
MAGDIILEQKIKQDSIIRIGENIRTIRKSQNIGQTELVRQLQITGINMTRETLVKIERGIQHIQAAQLQGIRDVLQTTYDELLK